jgi:hypothetical protein
MDLLKMKDRTVQAVRMQLVYAGPEALIDAGHPDARDNRYGLEGGFCVEQAGQRWLFVAEVFGEPKVVRTRLALWQASAAEPDGWKRVATLKEGSGDYTGKDPLASLWDPTPIYDPALERWTLFFVAYRAAPDTDALARRNFHGRIYRMLSEVPGREGIAGPYTDQGVVMEPGADSDWWEGVQGVDSFYPWPHGDGWLAFYGSNSHHFPWAGKACPTTRWFGCGLAAAKSLAGPWQRLSEWNPVLLNHRFIENPLVFRVREDLWIVLYDSSNQQLSYAWSVDGMHWSKECTVDWAGKRPAWLGWLRTPLSLLPEKDGSWTVYVTAFNAQRLEPNLDPEYHYGFGSLGRLSVRLEIDEKAVAAAKNYYGTGC